MKTILLALTLALTAACANGEQSPLRASLTDNLRLSIGSETVSIDLRSGNPETLNTTEIYAKSVIVSVESTLEQCMFNVYAQSGSDSNHYILTFHNPAYSNPTCSALQKSFELDLISVGTGTLTEL
jgi:hypothetical protein